MRRLALTVPLIAVLALAGCAPAAPEPISQADFVRQAVILPAYANLDEDALTELAEGLCQTLGDADDQAARTRIVEFFQASMEDENGEGASAARFARLSIDRFCPEYPVD